MNERPEFNKLMIIECSHCGEVVTIFSEETIKEFKCRKCNKVTTLNPDLCYPLKTICECGRFIKATTNSTKDLFDFSCKCGYPVTVMYNHAKNKYTGVNNQ